MRFPRVSSIALAVVAALVLATAPAAGAAGTPPTAPKITEVRVATVSAVVSWSTTPRTSWYRACLRRPGTTTCEVLTAKAKTTTATFRSLTPQAGNDYEVVVTATNVDGSTSSKPAVVELRGGTQPPPAEPPPAAPSGLTMRIGQASAVLEWKPATGAETYDVCLRRGTSTACEKTTPRSASPTATLRNLTGGPGVDYRVVVRSHRKTVSTEAAPKDLTLLVGDVTSTTLRGTEPRTSVTSWTPAANADAYKVEISTTKDMKTYLRTYTTDALSFTRSDMSPNRRYYARVTPINATRVGKAGPQATRMQPSAPTAVRVVTYNLCGQDKCRSSANKDTVPPWSKRKADAGRTVRALDSGIVSTQESGDKDTNFITQLPGFKRAAYQSAKSLFYDPKRFKLLRSGALTLDSKRKRYAVWAELEDVTTHTPFIVVDPHLEPYKGRANDALREAQTTKMLSLVASLNKAGRPVVYAGDVNSNKNNADQKKYPGGYDGVLKAFTAKKHPNALPLAQADGNAHNSLYNSANQGIRRPIKNGDHVDAFYLSPGIDVLRWQVVIDIVSPTEYVTPFPSDHNPLLADLVVPGLQEAP